MRIWRRISHFLVLWLCLSCLLAAQGNFYLKNGDRVVFYGDSITDQRLYTTFVESYVVTRFPGMNVSFVHSGWGGDRVTGGGGGPVDQRLQRDVIAYKPTVVTVMLGMNDGSYRAFDSAIFDTYKKGYQHIVEVLKDALPGVRLTLILPSPFDDVTRAPNFEGGYNKVLVRYGEFVQELARSHNVDTADLNTSVVESLKKAQSIDPAAAQKLIPDRVHPGAAGHLLMAAALLKAWNAPAVVSNVEIDAKGRRAVKAENARIEQITADSGLSWNQLDMALPLPVDLNEPTVALGVKASDVIDSLNRQMLRVVGLPGPRYTLKIEGREAGNFSREQLEDGINLALLPTPMLQQSLSVHALTLKHNTIHFARWRQVQVPLQKDTSGAIGRALAALDDLDADLVRQQRAEAQPKIRKFELVPAN
ncbi:MAG TPA: SGNH/GDSL hydrolase family protein [Acidobacteriota bacterium]|jgi:lysophospholipase L1-like esterase